MTQGNMMQPGLNGGMKQPGMQPGMMQPGMNGGMMQPGMQPGMMQPGMQGGGGFGGYSLPQRLAGSFMLQTGPNGMPLCPQLVPQMGEHLVFMNREKAAWVETNEYQWYMYNTPIATLRGSWQSNSFGHQTVHVRDMSGREIFMIRNTKHRWNPFSLRWSFRIHPPGNKNPDFAWYTINRNIMNMFGEEWYIYYE